jgi:hypothetical protein
MAPPRVVPALISASARSLPPGTTGPRPSAVVKEADASAATATVSTPHRANTGRVQGDGTRTIRVLINGEAFVVDGEPTHERRGPWPGLLRQFCGVATLRRIT